MLTNGPLEEVPDVRDTNETATLEANRTIREPRLRRETLRELDAGFLPARAGARTVSCLPTDRCTRGCAATKKCGP